MEKPVIAAKGPAVLSLDQGTNYWCRCGRSKSQPFCDGSHKGTGFTPMELTLTEKQQVALCRCKQTKSPPFSTARTRHSDWTGVDRLVPDGRSRARGAVGTHVEKREDRA